jgi:hypothetical protein
MRKIRRVERHPERLEQCSARFIHTVGNRKTAMGRHAHTFLQAAVFGGKTEEADIDAEIGITPPAPFAVVAGDCRIHGDTNSRQKGRSIAGPGIRPGTLDNAGTFMAGHHRVLNNGVAYPAVQIRVDVAAAYACGGDPHHNLSGTRVGRIRNCIKAQIVRPVQTDCFQNGSSSGYGTAFGRFQLMSLTPSKRIASTSVRPA